jgi:hypothetical protein
VEVLLEKVRTLPDPAGPCRTLPDPLFGTFRRFGHVLLILVLLHIGVVGVLSGTPSHFTKTHVGVAAHVVHFQDPAEGPVVKKLVCHQLQLSTVPFMTTPLRATCYGLCWRLLPYVRASFDNFVATAGRNTDVRFVICHNATDDGEQPAFDAWFEELQATGRATVVKCSKNVMGHALAFGMRAVPPRECDDFVVCTDLDLLVPRTVEWLPLAVSYLVPPINLTGFGLSAVNYRPPNSGWTPGPCFGAWLMTFRASSVPSILSLAHFIDVALLGRLSPYIRVPDAVCRLYHLTWDSPHEFPAYWAVKRRGFLWWDVAPAVPPDVTVLQPDKDAAVCLPRSRFASFEEVFAGVPLAADEPKCRALFTALRGLLEAWPSKESFAVAAVGMARGTYLTLLARTVAGVGVAFGIDPYRAPSPADASVDMEAMYAQARRDLENAGVADCTHLLRWPAADPVVPYRLKDIQGGVAALQINSQDFESATVNISLAVDVVLPGGLVFVMDTDVADVARAVADHLAPHVDFAVVEDHATWQVWRRHQIAATGPADHESALVSVAQFRKE